MTLGQQIRKLRIKRGLTTRELAERAGISQPSIVTIENGRSTPRLATLEAISDALGKSLKIAFAPKK